MNPFRWLKWSFAERATFFGHEHSGSLAFFRVTYCLIYAITLFLEAADWDSFYEKREYFATPLFALVSDEPISFETFKALRYTLLTALVAGAAGFFTRPALLVAAVTFFLYEGTHLGFTKPRDSDYTYHLTNLSAFFFFILAFAPGVARHGFDSWRRGERGAIAIPEWPRKAMLGMLCFAYFGAGYQRLIANPMWIDGSTLQAYLLDKHIRYDGIDIGYWIAQHWELCVVFSVFTMALEFFYPVVLFFPRWKVPFLIGGLMLHAGIYATMRINFFVYFVYNYLLLVEWRWVAGLLRTIGHRAAEFVALPAPNATVPRGQRIACVGCIGLQLACVLGQVEAWPFSDFRVFRDRRNPAEVSVLFFARPGEEGGEPAWFPWRKQTQFRRVVTSEPERLIRHSAKPENAGEKDAMVRRALVKIQSALGEAEPATFAKIGHIRVFERRAVVNPETGQYEILQRFIADVPSPVREANDGG
jgi:hypothetical protein